MSRPWQDFGSRRSSQQYVPDHQPEIYAGPEEYMDVGSRGFLVNILMGKEEFGIDDAVELLRQATIKLYGGIKPRNKKFDVALGYVKIDFMDPESVKILPMPEGEEMEENTEPTKETTKTGNAGQEKHNGSSKTAQEAAKVTKNEKQDTKGKKTEEVRGKSDDTKTGKTAETAGSDKDKKKAESGDSQSEKSDINQDKKGESKIEYQWMKCSYKFKAYRTEIRNIMFIKSNVPDIAKVADSAMEIVISRKVLNGDAVRQLLPVHGVCQNDYHHLEVMSRRVLAPIFDENQGTKGFSVFLMDKLSDPGADILIETVRNSIWSINPSAWQSSPLTEPDIVVRLEIIGKKLILSCLTHFMRFRHYSPKLLLESGVGEAEDDDGTWVPSEVRKMQEMIRAEREKRRELERQREEEQRKEREKRREEAEARRRERIKEDKEREERRREKDREREKQRLEKKEEKKDDSKASEKKDDSKANEKKDDSKASEKKEDSKVSEKKDDSKVSDKKEEGNKKPEDSKEKEVKPKEGHAAEQKTDEKKIPARKPPSTESPPTKKAKVEEPKPAAEEINKEEAMEVTADGDKKTAEQKGANSQRGGRTRSKK